jgi:hypothetical protein
MSRWAIVLEQCDGLIKNGQIQKARHLILQQRKLHVALDSPKTAIRYVQILRRVGLLSTAIQTLSSLDPALKSDTDLILEEAGVLMDAGLSTKAERKLLELPNKLHRAQMLLGMLKVTQWDFDSASVYFSKASDLAEPLSYEGKLARLNALNTQIHLIDPDSWRSQRRQLSEAPLEPLLNQWLDFLDTQHEFFFGSRPAAIERFQNGNHEGRLGLVAAKWHLIASASKTGSPPSRSAILKFKNETQAEQAFEVLRDSDFILAVMQNDSIRAHRVLSQTRWPAYIKHAERIARRLAPDLSIEPKRWVFDDSKQASAKSVVLGNPIRFLNDSHSKNLLPHHEAQLFYCLARDTYSPINPSAAFESVYPDADYDDIASGDRIRKLYSRLQKRLTKLDSGIVLKRTHNHRVQSDFSHSHWQLYRRVAA